MDYELIEGITSADIAVRVKAKDLSLLFEYGARALISEIVEDIYSIEESIEKEDILESDDIVLLYFEFLNELVFYKDAENLLLLPSEVAVVQSGDLYTCSYRLTGEKINRSRHNLKTDIKAVTLHGMTISNENDLYIAEAVFDV